MTRRISTTVDQFNGDVAIQPTTDDLREQLFRAAWDFVRSTEVKEVSLLLKDHRGATLVNFSSMDEERTFMEVDARALRGFEHQVVKLPNRSADFAIGKDADRTEATTQPENVQRFGQLIQHIWLKVSSLVDIFSNEAAKESGKQVVTLAISFLKTVGKVLSLLVLAYILSRLAK